MRIKTAFIIVAVLAATACKKTPLAEDVAVKAKVSVDVVGLSNGIVQDQLTLFANTLYLNVTLSRHRYRLL